MRLCRRPVVSVQLQPIAFSSLPFLFVSSLRFRDGGAPLLLSSSWPSVCLLRRGTPVVARQINASRQKQFNVIYLASGLFLFELLEFFLFLDALFAPFGNVFLQHFIELSALLILTILNWTQKMLSRELSVVLQLMAVTAVNCYLENVSSLGLMVAIVGGPGIK